MRATGIHPNERALALVSVVGGLRSRDRGGMGTVPISPIPAPPYRCAGFDAWRSWL
jgi:hypothetical protein